MTENVISRQNFAIEIKKLEHIHSSGRAKLRIYPKNAFFSQNVYYGRMIEISGPKHFRLHTGNAEKIFVVRPLLLVKNIQNAPSN